MNVALVVETSQVVPLCLGLVREGVGGITGKSPTVALRNVVTGQYLDWGDNTFKFSGWTLRRASMADQDNGNYQRIYTPAGVVAGDILLAEFHVDDGVGVAGEASDMLVFVKTGQNSELLRKALTNRMWEAGGAPGHLTLFDDDDSTPLLSWQLRDERNGGIAESVGTPSRRSKAT